MAYYYLSNQAYRTDKNIFPTLDEAKQKGKESARILGKGIEIYELNDKHETNPVCMVNPDGSVIKGPSPFSEMTFNGQSSVRKPNQVSPAILGSYDLKRTLNYIEKSFRNKGMITKASFVKNKLYKILKSNV